MYLHLGNDVLINTKDIIGIFDIENTSTSRLTKKYLNDKSDKKTIVNVSYEMPKSFIICKNNSNEEILYISQISVATLRKRASKDLNCIKLL